MLTDLFFALSIHKSTKVIVDGLTIEQAIGACYLHGTLPLTILYLRVQARRDKGTYNSIKYTVLACSSKERQRYLQFH
jgi:hypothetical protein